MNHSDFSMFAASGLRGLSRRRFLKYSSALSAAAAVAASVGACSGPDSTNAVDRGGDGLKSIEATMAFVLSTGFDPMSASSAIALAANYHIFEGLMEIDPVSRRFYPGLAAAEPKASADGLTYTVTVRDGAKFSDGSPVTAEDVAWSYTRIMDPANKALLNVFVAFIDTVTAKDAKTVEFKLKYPFPLFSQRVAAIKIVPRARTGDAAAAKAFDTAPVGTGPFKVDSASKESGIKLSKNPNYNGPRKALVDRMTWNTTTEASARLSDLRGGRVQAIEAVPYLNVEEVKSTFKVQEVQGFNCLFLMFNCSAAPFNDKRVRQALHYALDKNKIINTALVGNATPATSYLDENNTGYQRAATVFDFNPDKAKSLLAEAGASRLNFELVTTDVGFIKDSAPLLVEAWKAIGLNVTLNTVPSAAVYGDLVPKDTFRVLAASGDPSIFAPDADLIMRWFYYGEAWPRQRARMSPADANAIGGMLEAAAKQADQAKQKALWKECFDWIADQAAIYPVFHTKTVTAWDEKKLKNFKGAPSTGLYFMDVERTA